MVPIRSEFLLPSRVFRFGIRAADIAGDNLIVFAQFRQRPLKITDRKLTVLPIRDGLVGAQAIHIDCYVNIRAAKIRRELLKMIAPVVSQDRVRTLSIVHWAIVGPGMNFELAISLRPTVRKNVVRPPAFKISAAPDRNVPQLLELKRAIDPAAASPFRRANVPIGMIIERNQNASLRDPPKPKPGQIMKIARSVQNEWFDARRKFAIKLFNYPRRRGKTQPRAPFASFNYGQLKRFAWPRFVQS